jgi:hypothetical protein
MDLIRFDRAGGPVTVAFKITGTVAWRYSYQTDGPVFVRKSSQGAPPPHALGTPADLDSDLNTWSVQFASVDDKEHDFSVTIEWQQDRAKIHEWRRSGTVKGNDPKVEMDNAFLMGQP